MESIGLCKISESAELQKFINDKWCESHILAINNILLNFQHKNGLHYNFVISRNANNEISAILGFIPTSQYDIGLMSQRDIWLAIWKSDVNSTNPGIGFALLKWIEKNMQPQTIGAIGINEDVLKIYKVLGYETGILKQYYIINNSIEEFNIAQPSVQNQVAFIGSKSELKEISYSEINNIKFSTNPSKSLIYLRNRYLKHPYYKYIFVGVFQNDALSAVLVIRKIEVNESSCLRIVDICGDYSKIENISAGIDNLLKVHKSEYIDCLNHGISDRRFFDWGFNLRDAQSIIPNYFEPYFKKNIDILFAYKSKKSKYIIFKGDSDQDRPSIL